MQYAHMYMYINLIYVCLYVYKITYDMYMGVSENSVPLNPMVNDHSPY